MNSLPHALDDRTSSRGVSGSHLALLGLVLILGTVVRLWGLGSWQWEQDELYTLRDSLSLMLSSENAPGIAGRPLYYLLQHALLAVLPQTPFFLRLPAFTFGVLGVLACWWTGRRILGPTAGLVAAFLAAISPWHLQASQFARYWTLVFLLATLTFGLLPRAIAANSRRQLALCMVVMLLGVLSHPTFLFPMVGVVAALHLVDDSGRFALVWPTRRAWVLLWAPFALGTLGMYILVALTGHGNALRNMDGRGFLATIRLVPAMVQWTPMAVAVAAVGAAGFLLSRQRARDRRLGLMTLLGGLTGLAILLGSSLSTGVYADYGIAMLPLAFLAAGGAVQGLTADLGAPLRGWAVTGAVALLGVEAAPGVVSHMLDGSRFDYRSAYEWIARVAPDRPVTGGIDVLRRRYTPQIEEFSLARGAAASEIPSGFWFVASFQRYGLREGGPGLQRWIDVNCRRIRSWERGRIDYRVYRVELHWCGHDPAPKPPGR